VIQSYIDNFSIQTTLSLKIFYFEVIVNVTKIESFKREICCTNIDKLWWLILEQSTKQHVVGLTSCCPVTNVASQTALCHAVCCCDVTLSLGSNRRIGYFFYEPVRHTCSNNAAQDWMFGVLSKRQDGKTTVRQRPVWRVSLATRRKGDNDIGCVVAINNPTCTLN
jgi:hypothetical protein